MCLSCNDFHPVRRYHPQGKFNNDNQADLVTAENFQYAYGGGESQGVVDYSQDHKVHLDHGQAVGFGSSFPTSVTSTGGLTSGFGHSLTSPVGQNSILTTQAGQGTGNGQPHSQATAPGHVGEVDLTASGSDTDGYSYGQPESHGYPPPDHHEYLPPDHFPGYSYGPPDHHLEYLPPKPAPPPHQAKESSYTYYYLGRHLWYIPLYFSIYFIIYVGALVLKSVARHKILFPEHLKEAATAAQTRALRQLQLGQRKFYM